MFEAMYSVSTQTDVFFYNSQPFKTSGQKLLYYVAVTINPAPWVHVYCISLLPKILSKHMSTIIMSSPFLSGPFFFRLACP